MPEDSVRKLQFAVSAVTSEDPFEKYRKKLDAELVDAIQWVSEKSPGQVREHRDRVIRAIVALGAQRSCVRTHSFDFLCLSRAGTKLREDGAVDQWFEGADSSVRGVSKGINGPLWEHLAERT